MASPQLSSSQTRLPSIKEMFPEHLLAVQQPSFSPPFHHRDISQHYSHHSGSITPPSHRRLVPLSRSSHLTAHIPRALSSPMAQASLNRNSSSYQEGYPASISRSSSPTPPTSSSTALKSGLTEHRSSPKRLNSQIYSFDVLKSDPSSDSLQHIASSATFPHRSVPSTCQSTSEGLANGSTPVFRVNVAGRPASPGAQSTAIIKGRHVTHQHSPHEYQQPMHRRHSIAVSSNDIPATHANPPTAYASDRPSSSTHSHAPSDPSDRSHYSSILSFSRPDCSITHPRSYLHQGRPAAINPNRSIGQDREQAAKLSEPITIGVRRTDASAGISNGNRPFNVGGNGLGFGFEFGDGHSHGNTHNNGNGATSATNGVTGKKHICPTCSKKFNRPSSLKIHVNTHTGATPFRCPFPNCGREFNVNSNMRRHYRNHGSPGLVRSSSGDDDNDLALAEDNSDGNRRRRRQLSNASFPAVDMDMSIISSVAPASHGNLSRPVDLSANTVSTSSAYTFVVGSVREAVGRKRRKLDDGYVASGPRSIPSLPPSSDESEDESDGEQLRAPHHPPEEDMVERGRRSSRIVGYSTSAAHTPPRGERTDMDIHSPRYPSRSRSRSRSDNMVTGSSSSFPYSSATSTASSVLSASLPSTPASISASPPPPMKSNYSQDGKARDHLYSPSEPYSKSFADLHVSTALRPAFGEFQHRQSGTPPRDYAKHRHSRRDEHHPYPTREHPPPRRWTVSGTAIKEESAGAW